jgi:hypothetical protein
MRVGIALILLALAAPAAAQTGNNTQSNDTIIYGQRAPRWAGQLTALTTNVVFGGLTAGVIQELRGGSFKDGFTRGALGGGITYVGKRVSAERFAGAGFMGREIAAVGSAVVRNASAARPAFERLVFPVGPVTLHVWPRQRRFDASVDVIAVGWMVYGFTEPELNFAAGESLSAGTAVFRTDNRLIMNRGNRTHAGGFAAAGIIFQSFVPAWGEPFLERTLAHERVHVAQEDQFLYTIFEPAADWLLAKVPHGSSVARRVDFNLSAELFGLLSNLFPKHIDRPWELEATYLSR